MKTRTSDPCFYIRHLPHIQPKNGIFFVTARLNGCFTIMSNHIHLVLHKLDRVLFRIMQSLKRYSCREANKVLNRIGKPFWQDESYDRLIRDEDELAYRISYTMNNPVKAGLCKHWSGWPHSYIRPGFERYIISE